MLNDTETKTFAEAHWFDASEFLTKRVKLCTTEHAGNPGVMIRTKANDFNRDINRIAGLSEVDIDMRITVFKACHYCF